MRSSDAGPAVAAPVTYWSLLRNREYAGLLGSRLVSLIGDQVAWVALAVLVFDRTGSGLLAAAAYGATIVPSALSPFVSGIADRWPRRRVLISTDLLQALLFAVMAIPGVPWPALILFVASATLLEGPRDAARMPLVRSVLVDEPAFRAGTALDEMVEQPGQIGGFLVAGLLLAVAAPQVALVIDAGSFVVSALVLRCLVGNRAASAARVVPRATAGTSSQRALRLRLRRGMRRAVVDARIGMGAALAPSRRRSLLLVWVAASAAIAPDALVAPWAKQLHAGGGGIGLLLAAPSLAILLALPFVGRATPRAADRAVLPLVAASLLPLVLCALEPPFPVALLLVALSGAGTTFTVLTRVRFMAGLPDHASGRAYSVAGGGLRASQGLCVLLAGVFGDAVGAGRGIALIAAIGAIGSVAIVLLTPGNDRPATIELPADSPAISLIEPSAMPLDDRVEPVVQALHFPGPGPSPAVVAFSAAMPR